MIILKGRIAHWEPTVFALIDKNGQLELSHKGEHRFVVDTGFAGDIAVPEILLSKMKVEFLGYNEFVLATKKRIRLPVFKGWIKIKAMRVQVEMIPGDELIGMKFLEKVGSRLIGDFKNATVKLIG